MGRGVQGDDEEAIKVKYQSLLSWMSKAGICIEL